MSTLDLNEMVVFVKVVEENSVSGAARALDMPKSTVSRRVSALEERLGAQLLLRTTRQLRLTDAGSVYFERAKRIIAEVEAAERAVQEYHDVPQGELRVSVPPLFGDEFLGPIVAEYLKRYPETTLQLDVSAKHVDLIRDGYDAVIRAGVLPDSSMVARRIGDPTFVYVTTPEYIERRGEPERPEDLVNHDIILDGSLDSGTRDWVFDSDDGLQKLQLKARLRVNSFAVARDAVLAGMGIAGMPAFVCAQELRSGELVEVLGNRVPRRSGIWIMFPENRNMSAKLRAFLDLVEEIADNEPPWKVTLAGS